MTKTPASVAAAFVLLLLNALVWLAFAVIVASGLHPSLPASTPIKWAIVFLALLSAALLMVLSIMLRKRSKVAYILAVAFLILLLLLTVADQLGLSDLIVLVIEVASLVLLVKDRSWYMRRDANPANTL